MTVERTRLTLAIILVAGGSLAGIGAVILIPLGLVRVSEAFELLERISAFYSPFVGMIVGFYFGKRS